ncbi:Hypothetical_protein [Hexamita inflata]|uniref:Hypothetical_protein n=1 Tax=Hexamita inflata TaxID=28002 RepID=A0AA86NVG6_9EUKA|nr:Hypothetical protein HINF_LOCUS14031 [Hexamita inflata]
MKSVLSQRIPQILKNVANSESNQFLNIINDNIMENTTNPGTARFLPNSKNESGIIRMEFNEDDVERVSVSYQQRISQSSCQTPKIIMLLNSQKTELTKLQSQLNYFDSVIQTLQVNIDRIQRHSSKLIIYLNKLQFANEQLKIKKIVRK